MSRNTARPIIDALEHGGPLTVAELSGACGLSRSAIRNRMSELVAMGSVTRRGDESPYRYEVVSATAPQVEALLRRAIAMVQTGVDPTAEVSGALALLQGTGSGGTPAQDMDDLREWAYEIAEEDGI